MRDSQLNQPLQSAEVSEGLTGSYDRWRSSRLGQITDALERDVLFERLKSVAGLRILDVGCGDGALASELARRGASVTGLDPDEAMLRLARRRTEAQRLSLRLVQGRAERLPFGDASFDRVLAVTVLCFVPEGERAVAEMARVLKPGGMLVIGELGRWSLWAAWRRVRGWMGNPVWRDTTFRSARQLGRLVEASGVEVTEIRGAVFYPPCGWAARLMASVDNWLGRLFTFGAAFIVVSGSKKNNTVRH